MFASLPRPAAQALILCAISLTGCTGMSDGHLLVVQNKFAMDTCRDLALKMTRTQERIDKLADLTTRAEQEAPGGLIAATVYGPDLASARTEMRMLVATHAEKRCTEVPDRPATALPAAPPPALHRR